jgi:hypothetical protein
MGDANLGELFICRSALATPTYLTGELAEWLIAPDSKSGGLSQQAQEFESPTLRSDCSITYVKNLSR